MRMKSFRLTLKRGRLVLQVSQKGLTGGRPEDLEEYIYYRDAKVEDLTPEVLKAIGME